MADQSPVDVVDDAAEANRFACKRCGAELAYQPGTTTLRCGYCGHLNEIEVAESAAIEELDYLEHLKQLEAAEPVREATLVKCRACGAEVDLPEDQEAFKCPFCRSDMLAGSSVARLIRPRAVLPFHLDRDRAQRLFRDWIGRLWFAPSDLKRFARSGGRLDGVYIPYWTYDSRTRSMYSGQRGDDYFETETYTANENGKRVQRQRQVRKTRWTPVEGVVDLAFDDVLVCGSRSLPEKFIQRLDPWDLDKLVPYKEEFIAGFRAEKYKVELDQGFAEAREIMAGPIRTSVRHDIGGDHQSIERLDTRHYAITFKHLLLPLWISAYRYRGKVYRFLVNARTGELQGERPWSVWKIVGLILAGLALILIVVIVASVG
ncbi:MAG: primosomal protein N' (replication factor Y) - superfamily II helicase [Phycisphaerales bacterium]|nr:primosomal protein N' (replication factor Y) - superfamily II helicase [Phycisphaerales bacterium]